MDVTKKLVSKSMYYELCKTIAEFKEAPTEYYEEGYMSDGEWLDVFYDLCTRLVEEMDKSNK